jgi:hypothetical protein
MGRSIFSSMMPQQPQQFPQSPMNPMQKMQMVMQAMTNPAAFVKHQFPDIPDDMLNDPNRIIQYLQQTRGITNDQLNQLMNTYGR